MKKFSIILLSYILIISILTGCGKKKENPMVDMDSIKTDGSYDDKHFFRKEIEKQKHRDKKYQKNNF